MKMVKALSGPLEGRGFAVAGRALIGRDSDCDIQLVESAASRKHACVLVLDDGSALVRDLKSRNGTTKDGEKIVEAPLADGDSFSVGDTTFMYLADAEPGEPSDEQLRLVGGPAEEPTTADPSEEMRALLRDARTAAIAFEEKRAEEKRAAAKKEAAAEEAAKVCCGSPLTERARAEGWPHCPACGAAI